MPAQCRGLMKGDRESAHVAVMRRAARYTWGSVEPAPGTVRTAADKTRPAQVTGMGCLFEPVAQGGPEDVRRVVLLVVA